jgi:hypothetical protein
MDDTDRLKSGSAMSVALDVSTEDLNLNEDFAAQ